jgi:hypothetical protein
LREKLRELYCNLIVVTSEGEGLKAEDKWQTDRPELSYESLAPLFANKLYKIPASAGAQRFFRPAINQLENYPGSKRSPKDILSAVRLAEFGCLSVLEQFRPPAKSQKSYGEAIARLQDQAYSNRIPAYVMKPHLRHLKEKALAQRDERLWGPEGGLGRRIPRIRNTPTEQEPA